MCNLVVENLKQAIVELQDSKKKMDIFERGLNDVMLHTHGSTAHIIAKNALIEAGVLEHEDV